MKAYTLPISAALCLLLAGIAPAYSAQTYTFSALEVASASRISLLGINASNQVVGTAEFWNTYSAVEWSGNFSAAQKLSGVSSGGANAINDAGVVAGYDYSTGTGARATVWNGGVATTLTLPSGRQSWAVAINNQGAVAGSFVTAAGFDHAALWKNGVMMDLGANGGFLSAATGINNTNQVVGIVVSANTTEATLWDGTTAKSLAKPGTVWSRATDINNHGLISGATRDSNNRVTATVWTGDTQTLLGNLDGKYSYANAVNDSGMVVGSAELLAGALHAVLWRDDKAIDLNSLLDQDSVNAGWVLTNANSINNDGSIVGNAYNSKTGKHWGFLMLASPVPEPTTYGMLLAGLGLMGLLRRRIAQAKQPFYAWL